MRFNKERAAALDAVESSLEAEVAFGRDSMEIVSHLNLSSTHGGVDQKLESDG